MRRGAQGVARVALRTGARARLGRPMWLFASEIGRSGEIRTPDPLLPKQVRYQAALRSDPTVRCRATWGTCRFALRHSKYGRNHATIEQRPRRWRPMAVRHERGVLIAGPGPGRNPSCSALFTQLNSPADHRVCRCWRSLSRRPCRFGTRSVGGSARTLGAGWNAAPTLRRAATGNGDWQGRRDCRARAP